jgi:ribosomal protein S18 acetylase RimI-like enzyme
VLIRPYQDDDRAGIDALVDDSTPPIYVWKQHSLHGPDRDGARWRRTRVAVGPSGSVAGAVTVVRHSIHTGQYALVVEVAPAHRRQGLGRRLVAEARELRPEPLPLVVQIVGSDTAGLALLRAVGGQIVQTTPSFRPVPAAMLDWAAAQPVPPGVRLAPLTGVPRDELVAAWVQTYVWQHVGWASEVSVPALTPRMAEMVDAIAPDLSVGAWAGDRLAATVLIIPDDGAGPGGVQLLTETVRRDEPDGTAILAAALAECFRTLAARGIPTADLDGHVTDPHLDPVTRTFPPGIPTTPLHTTRLP